MSLPHKTAGYLASIFWAAITAGRLVSIPLSYRFQPVRLLMFNIVRLIKRSDIINETNSRSNTDVSIVFSLFLQAGAIVTVLMLLIFYTSSTFLFVGTCLCGLFLSSIFPCMLAYTEDILDYQGIMKTLKLNDNKNSNGFRARRGNKLYISFGRMCNIGPGDECGDGRDGNAGCGWLSKSDECLHYYRKSKCAEVEI